MESHTHSVVSDPPTVAGRRHVLIGKFAGLSKRAAQQMIREHGGKVREKIDSSVQVIVHGEAELPKSDRLSPNIKKNQS